MKICVVGASGGIGRELCRVLEADHEVVPVFRSRLDANGAVRSAGTGFDDDAGLSAAIGGANVTIHAALDTKARGKAFIPANAALTDRVLSKLDPATCKLFVYFSSQVVYSAIDAKRHPVYSEGDEIAVQTRIDAYTRLKIDEEKRVRAACDARGIPWLIVRPSVVTGPGMNWSTGMVDAMRKTPVGLGGRTINLIHVTDLAQHLKSLIEQGISGEVFNLADRDVNSGDFFATAAQAAGRKALILPGAITALAGRMMPSTMWFFAHDIEMRSDKLKSVSRYKAERALADHFIPLRADRKGARLEDILENARAGRQYQATGRGYSQWFQDAPANDTLSLARYEGIVRQEGQTITVLAGTRLSTIITYLDEQGLALATLPEFVGVSAGACFFTEVHGSSSTYATLYDLIEAIRYVDEDGEERESRKDFALWDRLRRRRDSITLTEITFRCVPQHYLANVIQWRDDAGLEAIVAGGYAENEATTVHWFPGQKCFLIYNINPVDRPTADDQAPFLPMRGLPYSLQKLLLALRMPRGRRIVGNSHEVLGTWRSVPARPVVGAILKRMRPRFRNMELCIPIAQAEAFLAALRQALKEGVVEFPKEQGIGIRFSRHAASDRAFMWVETSSANQAQLHALAALAREICGDSFRLHRGKYVPPGIEPEQLFIPRAI